jgi:hypothetical protein
MTYSPAQTVSGVNLVPILRQKLVQQSRNEMRRGWPCHSPLDSLMQIPRDCCTRAAQAPL